MNKNNNIYEEILQLLSALIRIPSVSREEKGVADYLEGYLEGKGLEVGRVHNNIWARSKKKMDGKPVVLLNSHLDTVRASGDWDIDPFGAVSKDGKVFGLGSNDATGPLVSLLGCFLLLLQEEELGYEPVFLASAEEEISGDRGIRAALPSLGPVALGIVGEPTGMQMAVAEKGLMVVDAWCRGQAGHAASGSGINAIYRASEVIAKIRELEWNRNSGWLGATRCQVTQIQGGNQHNVVPDSCHLVLDIRVNERYANTEVLEMLREKTGVEMQARSTRLQPSFISPDHPVVQKGLDMGLKAYGSGRLSDQALMSFPSLKIGPGDPERSHRANEFIHEDEIRSGITSYHELLKDLRL